MSENTRPVLDVEDYLHDYAPYDDVYVPGEPEAVSPNDALIHGHRWRRERDAARERLGWYAGTLAERQELLDAERSAKRRAEQNATQCEKLLRDANERLANAWNAAGDLWAYVYEIARRRPEAWEVLDRHAAYARLPAPRAVRLDVPETTPDERDADGIPY